MRIIANADDFGFDQDTLAATVACFDEGSVTSASIMPNMPASAVALAYARSHPEFSFGVHMTFCTDVHERPLSPPHLIPTLVTGEGAFWPSQITRMRALLCRLSIDDIRREMTAQLAQVVDAGVRISHVDSHGHLHKFGVFRRALEAVLPRFGIRKVRSVQDLYLRKPWKSPTYWLGRFWRRGITRRFLTTDHLYLPSSAGDTVWTRDVLRIASGDSLEIGVHPGLHEPWRAAEYRAIRQFATELDRRRHLLVGWADL